jgi:peptidoglycan L-alanyl-D-glutamate endopeptidase CwlK
VNKEALQISIGVSAVAAIGVGAFLFLRHKGMKSVPKRLLEELSEHNRREIMQLHPNARRQFAEFIKKVEAKGYKVVITSGYRSFEKQARLHRENSKNAKAGYSSHNYGYALDINIYDPKTGQQLLKKASSKKSWEDSGIVDIAKNMGFTWGGDFRSYHDPIHFAIPREKSTAEMRALVNAGEVDNDGYVLAFAGRQKPALEFELPNELAA